MNICVINDSGRLFPRPLSHVGPFTIPLQGATSLSYFTTSTPFIVVCSLQK
jgi:hypothetical protein